MRALLIATTFLVLVVTAAGAQAFSPNVSVFASGLNNPRGLTFGPDGNLYVAEGGDPAGNIATTSGRCPQVGEVGPYTGGHTSRISRISTTGMRTTVVDQLPSSSTSAASGSLTSGVADVKFLDGKLYGIEAGAGCSHGLAGTHNSLFRVNANGTTTEIANLSAFQAAHPVAHPDCCDFEPDGTWYSMVASRGAFYAVEPNHQEIDRVEVNGEITRVLDMSAHPAPEWLGPTSLSLHGAFYFGTLGTFPVRPGTEAIWRMTPSGEVKLVATGLTTVLGTAWDKRGRLYALESITAAGFPAADPSGTGKVVRIEPNGRQTTVADGLTTPSAMTFGPDGALYVSNNGFGAPAGAGQILRIAVPS
jgi:hypothetical protein